MKTKQILCAVALFFSIGLMKAQEKYEYMIIEFNYFLKKEIQVSIDGKSYIEEKADYSPNEVATHNANPLLKKVREYEAQEWELMNFHTNFNTGNNQNIYYAYMKKKRK